MAVCCGVHTRLYGMNNFFFLFKKNPLTVTVVIVTSRLVEAYGGPVDQQKLYL